MMNKQVLNEKLAEWAFPDADTVQVDEEHIFVVFRDTFRKQFGNEVMYLFTQSLDACFKWLVPKLEPRLEKIKALESWLRDYLFDNPTPEPALALCLAIEKLIDKED